MSLLRSTRFGEVEVEATAVLEFPDGLIGLAGTRFALLAAEEGSLFSWLHSMEDPALALPVARPWELFPDYEVELSDEETSRLGWAADARPEVWVVVRAAPDPAACTANLKAPILAHEGRAHQVINEAPAASVQAPLFPAAGAPAA